MSCCFKPWYKIGFLPSAQLPRIGTKNVYFDSRDFNKTTQEVICDNRLSDTCKWLLNLMINATFRNNFIGNQSPLVRQLDAEPFCSNIGFIETKLKCYSLFWCCREVYMALYSRKKNNTRFRSAYTKWNCLAVARAWSLSITPVKHWHTVDQSLLLSVIENRLLRPACF